MLATFPLVPSPVLVKLWQEALGTSKTLRPLAQACLTDEPDRRERIEAALGDGKQEVRAAAAQWLGQLRLEESAAAIEGQLQREKSDVARAAQLGALERLGRPVAQYLDRDALAAEAAKGLKKSPKALLWLGELPMPQVAWADTGEPVDESVLRWWLVKTAKLKSPAPDPLLRRYVGMLRSDDMATLGTFALETWIHEDTRAPTEITPADRQRIQREAQSWAAYYPNETVQQIAARFERAFLTNPIGSAIQSKGMLAVAAACGVPEMATVVGRYLKTWYGLRAAQCKALLGMLAATDDPAATQLLLATSVRFRTAGIRKEAEKLVAQVAEDRGWTMDELADRTLPSAGFEDDGEQTLVYRRPAPEGMDPDSPALVSRAFRVRLDSRLEVTVVAEDDKQLKNLPAARKDETKPQRKPPRRS